MCYVSSFLVSSYLFSPVRNWVGFVLFLALTTARLLYDSGVCLYVGVSSQYFFFNFFSITIYVLSPFQ